MASSFDLHIQRLVRVDRRHAMVTQLLLHRVLAHHIAISWGILSGDMPKLSICLCKHQLLNVCLFACLSRYSDCFYVTTF